LVEEFVNLILRLLELFVILEVFVPILEGLDSLFTELFLADL